MITVPGGAIPPRRENSLLFGAFQIVSVAVTVLEVLQYQSLCTADDFALFVEPATSAEDNEVGIAF